jgi:hypothetical protein
VSEDNAFDFVLPNRYIHIRTYNPDRVGRKEAKGGRVVVVQVLRETLGW